MSAPAIECPHCHQSFQLTEALIAPLLESERNRIDAEVAQRLDAGRAAVAKQAKAEAQAEFAARLKASEEAITDRDAKLRVAQEAELSVRREREQLAQEKRELDLTVQRRVDDEKQAAATQAVAATQAEFAAKLKASEMAIADRDAKLRAAQEAELSVRREREQLAQEKRELDLTVQQRVDDEKRAAAKQAAAATRAEYQAKVSAMQASIEEKDAKLQVAEAAELEARKLKHEAEETKRQAELTISRRMDEERAKVRDLATRERDDEYRLKMAEKDKQIADVQQKLEEARRKGECGSQQLVGEVLERDLVDVLRAAFPSDEFEPVKKGQGGADVLQTVRNRAGRTSGRILWESKRTKAWAEGWLAKLRDDQREERADIAALVSETLRPGVNQFDLVEGVWVTGIATVVPMATALRQGLIETATARQAAAGAETAKDRVYEYLTGPEFRQRVRGAVEPVMEMRTELEREKRMIKTQWSTREKQIERITNTMTGMYGDLQGIAGASLPAVEGLSLEVNAEPTEQPKLAMVGTGTIAANDRQE
jgi:hypothetical protein